MTMYMKSEFSVAQETYFSWKQFQVNVFAGTGYFFRILWWIESKTEKYLFETEIFL